MKTSREVIKRLEAAEKKLATTTETRFVVRDFNGSYYGDCGFDLSEEQFDAWVKAQEVGVEITIMRYTADGLTFLGKSVLNFSSSAQENLPLPAQDKR